ncbi:ribonuclease P protein subunit p20 [Drosophila guanche]|uniref:Ribonuclease P protein subunit p20 n=1 Tax=Drosophila guanche TaxID=7266 RepID=A0A3B0K965_DROGU|nr:ribonuclease P protein subunit p20 [Drosophila guanche]SPP89893.1 blast:Ribonuclease P protein subunit p20 [Drosophila guanche]
MESNAPELGAKPRTKNINSHSGRNQGDGASHRVVRKLPPRAANDRRNIYITSKTDFKAQQKRCKELLNSGVKEIFLHCMGYSITRGLNLALRLIKNSEGALGYTINTSTIQLVDELHPLCDEDDITFRQRNNSALHIRIFSNNLFNIDVPQLPAPPALPKVSQREPPKPQQPKQQHQHPQKANFKKQKAKAAKKQKAKAAKKQKAEAAKKQKAEAKKQKNT